MGRGCFEDLVERVSLARRKLNVQEIYKLKGKVMDTARFVISDGGRTLAIDFDEVFPDGRKGKLKAIYGKE